MKPSVSGRLHAQGLDTPRFDTAVDVVRHLGCVQSQLHDMASVGGCPTYERTRRRPTSMQPSREGDFLRTHVLRPTWHFVDPSDIHWLLDADGSTDQAD